MRGAVSLLVLIAPLAFVEASLPSAGPLDGAIVVRPGSDAQGPMIAVHADGSAGDIALSIELPSDARLTADAVLEVENQAAAARDVTIVVGPSGGECQWKASLRHRGETQGRPTIVLEAGAFADVSIDLGPCAASASFTLAVSG